MSTRRHDASRRGSDANRWTRSRRANSARARPLALRAHLPSEPETIPTAAQLHDVWERHGGAAYALACALLGNEAAASMAVRLAMADLGRSTDGFSIQDAKYSLARHVYMRSHELATETPHPPDLPHVMVWLGQLAQLQRTCLALCLFGEHTYQDTAGLLGLPPVQVAELLTAGLREVGRLAGNEKSSRDQQSL